MTTWRIGGKRGRTSGTGKDIYDEYAMELIAAYEKMESLPDCGRRQIKSCWIEQMQITTGCDRSWNDYHVALTVEKKSFVALTT